MTSADDSWRRDTCGSQAWVALLLGGLAAGALTDLRARRPAWFGEPREGRMNGDSVPGAGGSSSDRAPRAGRSGLAAAADVAAAPAGFDLERAGPRALRRLPGVGEVRALELARARWERGAAEVFGDLVAQPGIGPLTAARVAGFLERAGVSVPPARPTASTARDENGGRGDSVVDGEGGAGAEAEGGARAQAGVGNAPAAHGPVLGGAPRTRVRLARSPFSRLDSGPLPAAAELTAAEPAAAEPAAAEPAAPEPAAPEPAAARWAGRGLPLPSFGPP